MFGLKLKSLNNERSESEEEPRFPKALIKGFANLMSEYAYMYCSMYDNSNNNDNSAEMNDYFTNCTPRLFYLSRSL